MRAAERVDHVQRVGADEQDRLHRVELAYARAAPRERERRGAREHRQQLHAPYRAVHAEQPERVGDQRVERAVGGRDLLPVRPDVVVDGVVHDRDRPVRVWVQAVLDAHPRVGDVAEHVGREQDRPDEDDRVQRHEQRDRPAFGDALARARSIPRSPPRRRAPRSGRRGSRAARRCPTASPRSRATWGSATSARRRRRARSRRSPRRAAARTRPPAAAPTAWRVCGLAVVRSARRRSRRRAAHKAVQTVFVSR